MRRRARRPSDSRGARLAADDARPGWCWQRCRCAVRASAWASNDSLWADLIQWTMRTISEAASSKLATNSWMRRRIRCFFASIRLRRDPDRFEVRDKNAGRSWISKGQASPHHARRSCPRPPPREQAHSPPAASRASSASYCRKARSLGIPRRCEIATDRHRAPNSGDPSTTEAEFGLNESATEKNLRAQLVGEIIRVNPPTESRLGRQSPPLRGPL